MIERSRSLQIYVKPGIKEDDILIAVWEAAKKMDRPQDVFRSMLRAGLMAMLESGEMPESIIDECHLDIILEKRMRRKSRKSATEQPLHPNMGVYQAPLPIPSPWPQAAAPMHQAPAHVPMPQPPQQTHSMPAHAPLAPHEEIRPQPREAAPHPAPVAAPRVDAAPQPADEVRPKPSQDGTSRVNRMKNLM